MRTQKESGTWQPDQKTVSNISQEILAKIAQSAGVYTFGKKRKPHILKELITHAAKVGAFLQNTHQVTLQLKKLNSLLVLETKQDIKKDFEHQSHHKILRNVLERELAKFGFVMGRVDSFLNGGMFREAIRNGVLLKDPGLRKTNHGDFSHAIQWLAIAWQQQDSDFLNGISVIELFKSLGNETCVLENDSGKQIPYLTENETGLWDIIVDKVPFYEEERTILDFPKPLDPDTRGFRVPNNLHIFLISNKIPALSYLKILILSREKKRISETQAEQEDKFEKNVKIKTYYSPCTLFSVQLPSAFLENKHDLKRLVLQLNERDFERIVPRFINPDEEVKSAISDMMKEMKKLFDKPEHRNIIEKFLNIKVCTNLILLQNAYYYIGLSFAGSNLIACAELYMRKGFYLTKEIEQSGVQSDKEYLIPKDEFTKELGTYQFLVRAKKAAMREAFPEKEKQEQASTYCAVS